MVATVEKKNEEECDGPATIRTPMTTVLIENHVRFPVQNKRR